LGSKVVAGIARQKDLQTKLMPVLLHFQARAVPALGVAYVHCPSNSGQGAVIVISRMTQFSSLKRSDQYPSLQRRATTTTTTLPSLVS
jgi:hypothetical protein